MAAPSVSGTSTETGRSRRQALEVLKMQRTGNREFHKDSIPGTGGLEHINMHRDTLSTMPRDAHLGRD